MMQFISKPQPNAPVISLPTVATPTFSPVAGSYPATQSVTISCSTPASNIFYTTDGTVPTTSSIHYTTPVSVSVSETLNAIATAVGFLQSAVGTAVYSIAVPQTATPTFAPVAGTYIGTQSVAISCTTPSSSIYFTTDGTTPTFPITGTTTLYTGSISVAASETLKAIGTASGFTNSAVASAAYVINAPVAATPTFSPVAGTYASTQTVTLTCSTPSSSIYFTTDGSTPTFPITGTTTLYTGAITVSATETIKAIGTAAGFANSSVGSATYVIGALSFDFFIGPDGDDTLGDGSLGNPWSLSAFNSKQSTYAGKKIGIIGDVAGVQTPITQTSIAGTVKTLYSQYQAQPGTGAGCIFNINGGTSTSTYIASCDSTGAYKARWAVIDFSQPGSGGTVVPTVYAFALGQNFFSGSVPNGGFLTFDGLVMKYFAGVMVTCSHVGATSNNFVVQNCEISNGGHVPSNNNPGAIYLTGCASPVITNNKIHDLQTITGGATAPFGMCAFVTFASTNITLTNNTFYNCSAVLTKDTHQQFLNCSYNYLDHGIFGSASAGADVAQGAITGHSPAAGQVSIIHHNIFLGALNLHAQDGINNAGTTQCFNNTFYGSPSYTAAFNCVEGEPATSGAALQFQHNIVYAANTYDHGAAYGNCIWITANIAVTNATFNNNVYGSNSNGVAFGQSFGQAWSLATWKANTGCDQTSVLVSATPFSGTPTAQVPSSFATNSSVIIGGVTCGALDGSGSVGCNF